MIAVVAGAIDHEPTLGYFIVPFCLSKSVQRMTDDLRALRPPSPLVSWAARRGEWDDEQQRHAALFLQL